MKDKTGVFSNGLIWFGAAVSIAEIEAGFSIGGNWLALVAGHLLGGLMLFAAGLIGAKSGKNAMETTEASFGMAGRRFFAALNLLQLVGWTAVMIAQGGEAVSELTGVPYVLPCLALAVLIGVWIFIAFGDRLHLASIAMGALALLSMVLTFRLLQDSSGCTISGDVGFWSAFEVSIAMPLSWLPLISDYTSAAARPRAATAVSAIVYTLVSVWMYALGVLLAGVGATSVADGIVRSGIGTVGLVVVVFSTVTTTFLDAYSAGESIKSILCRPPASGVVGVAVCASGGGLAIAGIMNRYIDFLYLISSVFAPMATVLIIDHYFIRRGLVRWNLVAWLAGFTAYQFAGKSPIGPTLTSIAVSAFVMAVIALASGVHRSNRGVNSVSVVGRRV